MIEIEKVCVDFTAGRGTTTRAVDDVSLPIAAGEIFGIVGTSGAGKSTPLRTLKSVPRPTPGRVHVHGVAPSP
ncbi:ATP-binding cassette domain-containing protein, partial [Salmonella enterica]|uniref:ATP-binding cassette domain-containing protein n=1 Tax=Salmonella enterica TaxID=28901 RepID=UPI000B2B87F6